MPLNYSLADIGMIGLRDVLVVAPAASFHPQHQHHHHNDAAAMLSPTEHPIIPLLTAAPCLVDDPDAAVGRGRIPTGINLWQNQPTQQPGPWAQQNPYPGGGAASSYLCKPMPMPVLDSASATATTAGFLGGSAGGKAAGVGGLMAVGVVGAGGGIGVADGVSSSMTCQDCGNKAKKDCVHRRCRSCCKSRGFDCSTHLKSTWVPAAQRRERQMSSAATPASGGVTGGAAGSGAGPGSSTSTSATKKPRLVSSNDQAATATGTTNTTSTSNTTTPPRSFDTGSSHQDASFRQSLPRQVRTPAVFKCVKVTSMDDGEDEYAYQAMVKIRGHIFKGFLYDQGVAEEMDTTGNHDSGDHNNEGGDDHNNNNRTSGIPNISELHLGGAAGGGGGGGGVPSDVYAAGLGGGLMGGTAYGNPIN